MTNSPLSFTLTLPSWYCCEQKFIAPACSSIYLLWWWIKSSSSLILVLDTISSSYSPSFINLAARISSLERFLPKWLLSSRADFPWQATHNHSKLYSEQIREVWTYYVLETAVDCAKIFAIAGSMLIERPFSTVNFAFLSWIVWSTHYLNGSPITENATFTIHWRGSFGKSLSSG